ncbi:IS3 family transposase, partial [Alkalicoccus saliphilus]|uniref:IS3 family transposase n=1 Tax=Alkalicoccus saliphilus TaxID=200989 RepID=UPI003CCC3C5F
MTKKTFTEKEINQLSLNPYVKAVSAKGITYTEDFKQLFIAEREKGKFSRQIFEEAELDAEILGMERIRSARKRWEAAYQKNGVLGLHDTRKGRTGRTGERSLSLREKNVRLEAQINLLQAENELLKKNSVRGKGAKEVILPPGQKFLLIRSVIKKYKLQNMVRYLCRVAGVSRSGYYNYFSSESQERRNQREAGDEALKHIILKAFCHKNRKKGARQIKMTLAGLFKMTYNLKRIRRIMKKYNIICPFRKANPYRRLMKATQEHSVVPNLLERQFNQGRPGKVLLTDITYLTYGKNSRAYLSVILDGSSGEALAYQVSDRMTIELATDTLKKLKKNKRFKKQEDSLLHSDQGVHYTHPQFQKMVKQFGLRQSMSRRGNCWDNAPIESFFGHLKDETSLPSCLTLQDLHKEMKQYMTYYNHHRYQWN